MNITKSAALFCLFSMLSGAGFLFAQEGSGGKDASGEASSRTLTLEEASRLAEENSIALQKQAVDLEMDRMRAKNLWAQVFPSISLNGGANYTVPVKGDGAYTESYTASLRLSLGLSSGLPFTMTAISLAYKNSLLNYEQARRALTNQTAKTFYALLSLKNNLSVLEGALRLAQEQFERNRIARQSGYVGELDFLSAQVGAERAKLAYNRALSEYRNSLGKFLTALGLEHAEGISLEGEPSIGELVLDPELLIRECLSGRPDMIVQRNEIERLKNLRSESFLSNKGPQVNLSASWGASLKNGFDDTLSAGLSVTIPIDPWIPGTKADQAAKRAGAEYRKALLELENMENNARQEIRSAADNIAAAWAEVEIARLQAGYAGRAYEIAEQSYRRGTMNFLDFETLRERLTEARQQQLQSELSYKMLVLDLALSLNMNEGELLLKSEVFESN